MANRYWVGGSGTWDTSTTTNWSATSGGAGGASVPTTADNVFFDANSAAGNYTVTGASNINALDLNIAKATAGTLTFAGTGTLIVAGNLNTVGTGVTWGMNSNFSFTGTAVSVTTGGVTFNRFVFNAVGGTFTLQDTVTLTVSIQLNNGTLNFNNQTVTAPILNISGATARTLDFSSGGILNLNGSGATVINAIGSTNLTILGTSVVNLTYSGSTGTRTVNIGVGLVGNFNINVTAGSDILVIATVIGDLNLTGFTGTLNASARTIYGNLVLGPGMTAQLGTGVATTFASTSGTKTITTNGVVLPLAFTFNGVGGTWQLQDDLNMNNGSILSFITLLNGNLDLNNKTVTIGVFATNSATARSLVFRTNSVINLFGSNTIVWSAASATNFTYTGTGTVNFTYNGSTGTRTITHGTSAGNAQLSRAPSMYITAGSDTIITTSSGYFTDLNFTGFTGTLTNTLRYLTGNLILGTGMTATAGANATTFNSQLTTTQTITTNGVTTDFPVTINSSAGNFQLSEPLVLGSTRTLTVNSGNLRANGFNITTGLFSVNSITSRIVDISNVTVSLTGTGTILNAASTVNLTFTSANSTVTLTDTSNSNKILSLGRNITYNNLVISGGGTSPTSLTSSGNVTIDTLSSTRTVPQTLIFSGSATNFLTINNWNMIGTVTAPVTITSNSLTPFNLIYGGTGNVNVSYHAISYSNASPSNTWYSLFTNNNSDGGNNTGWIFTNAVPTSSNFFLVF